MLRESPWGAIAVADAHVHFFSHRFFAALASQKNYMSLYLMSVYCGCADANPANAHARWFREAWAKTGKKLDMGKACIRFRKAEDLPLDLIGEAIGRVPASLSIAFCEALPANG